MEQLIVRIHRLAHACYTRRVPLLPRLLEIIIRLVYSAAVPPAVEIGKGVHFGHNALAVVINRACTIGDRCFIGSHVVLGGRHPHLGAPKVEAGVVIHAGAKVLGNIIIGEGAMVGANAVVLEDVPPRCLVVGVPAKIRKHDVDTLSFRRELVPDES